MELKRKILGGFVLIAAVCLFIYSYCLDCLPSTQQNNFHEGVNPRKVKEMEGIIPKQININGNLQVQVYVKEEKREDKQVVNDNRRQNNKQEVKYGRQEDKQDLQKNEEDRKLLKQDIVAGRLVSSRGIPVQVLILLASVGRSGSTFLGELLSQQDKRLYLFEPLFYLYYINKDTKNVTQVSGTAILQDMIYCQISDNFVSWLRTRALSSTVFDHPVTQSNCRRKTKCLTVPKLTAACRSESNRIIKVIRMRMRWMRTLLDDFNIGLKVIHLVRDPRASIFSRSKNFNETLNAEYYCAATEDDLLTTPQLMREYPNKVMGITYEDFCIDPKGKATEIWRFITGEENARLPISWSDYLQNHTSGSTGKTDDNKYTYGTFRQTSSEYQAWRAKIDEKTLIEIETHCKPALKLLGYNLFGTLNQVRNLSIPLLVDSKV